MGGVSMEWKEVTLGEIAIFKTGKLNSNAAISNGEYPFFTCSPETLRINSYAFDQEAILLAGNNAEGNFSIKYYKGKFNAYQRTYVITPIRGKVDIKFLYYALSLCLKQLKNMSQGTSTKFLTVTILNSFSVKLPSISDQRRIASILSSLDRKIELNNKINADLEEMAQAIFKNWFVDFEPFKDGKFVDSELGMIPEGWKVGKITDIGCLITDYVSNGSFASLKQNVHLYETKEYAQFIRNTDLKTNTFSVYVDKHSYDFLSKSTLYGNEIIISNVGDVGSVHLCPKLDIPMTLGNNIIMLRPNEKEYNYFLYLWFKYFSGQGLIQGIKGGSAQPKFNKTDFKNLPLLIPSFEIIEKSYWIFESMFSILSSNVKESSRLSTLRDTLLPRLMSGELEVPE